MQNLAGKKVLFVITKSNLGGAQKYVYELACAVKSTGATAVVALGGTGAKNATQGPLVDQLRIKNIKTIPVHSFMRNMSFSKDIQALFELIKIIHSERPDILHVTSSKAGGIGALAGRICGVKNIIFTSHGLTFDEAWRPRHQRFAIKLLTWCTLMLSHQSIMISKDTYQKARALPLVKDKTHLIYNGVLQKPSVPKKEARHILAPELHKPQAVWIGGIGELHPNKNWLALIEAMPSLPTQVCCVIIGEGEQRALLEKKIAKLNLQHRVLLKGFVQDAGLLLAAYDIFVLPSYKEGLPYVLLEAGLAKCAVVASAISGNTDIIIDKTNGLLFTHTPKNLEQSILNITENRILRKEYGAALYKTVITEFSMDTMLDETLGLYT